MLCVDAPELEWDVVLVQGDQRFLRVRRKRMAIESE
jgi:hypothetical protein